MKLIGLKWKLSGFSGDFGGFKQILCRNKGAKHPLSEILTGRY
ncbi:hypothetical protein Hanom_Chr05g00434671 [Helianthus anomalus]